MPYTGSLAGVGLTTVISINTGSLSTPTWTAVGELRKCSLNGRQMGDADVSNFESTAREFVPTLLDPGTWDIEGNRIGGDAGQVAMEAALNALPPVLTSFKIALAKTANQATTGDTFTFNALVKEVDYTVEIDKAVTLTGKLKVSGRMTFAAGS